MGSPTELGGRSGTGCVMAWVSSGARHGLRWFVVNLAAVTAALTITSDAADARHYYRVRVHTARVYHRAHAEEYAPPYSSIVVDGNSGQALHETSADALRHPASLTKIMTLYLLFERLDAGKIKLDTQLKVSEHASEQAPTKLGLKPGQTIAVEDAIKGVVTRSANDAAVVIAESLGGDEDQFAKLMTQKAHALGMSRTTYVNASGLPDDDQITTARDQALLGRVIQERFPRYYKYFSTPSFEFHGVAIHNHDHLLGSVDGVDGIKTGFTSASGFNLVTSVHRDGRYLVAVVLGGRSASERDAKMRELINANIKEAAVRRTAPMLADGGEQHEMAQPVAFAKAPMAVHADPTPTATVNDNHAAAGANDPIKPLLVRTITFRTAPVQAASLAPMPALVPVVAPAPQPDAPEASASAQSFPASVDPPRVTVASADPASTALPMPPRAEPAKAEPAKPEVAAIEPAKAEAVNAEPVTSAPVASPTASARARGGWLIQIGAFDGEDEAKQHLSAAQIKVRAALAAADPFTERVQKGDKALYRARFAGFDKATAETACKELKRSDFECMALKD
jgi:D-alanyl-D-alanine carboxypeptidase